MSVETMNPSEIINVMISETEMTMNEILTLTLPDLLETFEESNQEQIIDENLMPPTPPPPHLPSVNINFEPGKFEYVKTKNEQIMLQTAYNAINMLELWNFLKEPCESFTFSDDNRVKDIYNKIEELGYCGHSGFSFGWTMRAMQQIAQKGEEAYMKSYLNIS